MKISNFSDVKFNEELLINDEFNQILKEIELVWKSEKCITQKSDFFSWQIENSEFYLSDCSLFKHMKMESNKTDEADYARLYFLKINWEITDRLVSIINKFFPESQLALRGSFLYKPGGFMSWHTNNNREGVRMYLTYADKADGSYFRYWDGEKIVTDWDVENWQIRMFSINKNEPFWHCVNSISANRLSMGIMLTS